MEFIFHFSLIFYQGEEYSQINWVGVCNRLLKTLNQNLQFS